MTLLVASACKIQKCQMLIVDLTIDLNDKPIDLKNIAIVHIKKIAYRICFSDMTKREAKKLMANSNLIDKKGVL